MSWLEMVESKCGDWTLMHQLVQEAKRVLDNGQMPAKVVLVNGCFDPLHPGHVRRFYKALAHGDILIVTIDRDEDVRRAKGRGRPALPWEGRAFMVAALPIVAGVTSHTDAPRRDIPSSLSDAPSGPTTGSASLPSLIRFLRPDVWVARHYDLPQAELDAARDAGTAVVPLERQGSWSSTGILRQLAHI